jgi:hypothetical protein
MRTTRWLGWLGFALGVGLGVTALGAAGLGCGGNDEPYKVSPAWSGKKANLPPVPQLPTSPVKVGDSYTVYGAIHHLNSRIHKVDVTGKDISITGYIVDTNIPNAPACAVHPTGKKDPDNCVTEIPTFTIADAKGDKSGQKIRVMGWASNFANVYDAMQKYKNAKDPPKHAEKPDNAGKPGYLMQDELWAVDIPYPLPSVGAKVKVTGRYGTIFGKSSSGLVADPASGVLTYGQIETIEPPTEPAAFMAKNGK